MRRLALFFCLLVLLAVPARAQSLTEQEADILGADTLWDGLDDEARALLEDASPTETTDLWKSLWHIVSDTLADLGTPLREALKTGCSMLAVMLLCSICTQLEQKLSNRAVTLAGSLALTAICTGSLYTMIGLAGETLDRVGAFTTLLLPVLSAALTASGGVTSGSALYVGSMLFFDVLVRLIRGLLIPLTYTFTALAAAECAVGSGRLTRLRKLLGWCIQTALKGLLSLFTAYLAVTGVVSGSTDAATVKAAGAALGAAVPVVGSILSDATEAVLAGASLIRSTAGVFGLLAITATGIAPFLRIGTHYLLLKLTAAAGAALDSGGHAGLMEALASAMGYMLAMTGSCLLMALMSCCCFMKAVRL